MEENIKNDIKQLDLFNNPVKSDWEKEWEDMPEFIQNKLKTHQQIIINFKKEENVKEFARLIKQNLTNKTRSIWFPEERNKTPSLFGYLNKDES